MSTVVTVAVTVCIVLLVVVLLGVRSAYTGATSALGDEAARSISELCRRHLSIRRARRRLRSGATPVHLLAAAAPAAAQAAVLAAQSRLNTRIIPTPGAATLVRAAEGQSGPVAGRRAAVLGIGPGLSRELDVLLGSTAPRTVGTTAFCLDPGEDAPTPSRVRSASGTFRDQLEAGLRWARAAIRTGDADFLAVLLRTPVTGNWRTESLLDIPRFIGQLLTGHDFPVWLTLTEPADHTAWPDEVLLTLPMSARTFQRELRKAGLLPTPALRRAGRRALRMHSASAAELLVALSDPLASHPDERTPATLARQYSAEITLALRDAVDTGAVLVELDDGTSRDLQDFLEAVGVAFTAPQPMASDLLLPISVYPRRIIAWRALQPATARGRPAGGSVMSDPPIRWLAEACDSQVESVAAAVLADQGRAWIESLDLASLLPLLERTKQAFPRASRAHLWAHYLLALDAALRRNSPEATWFDDQYCRLADATELGPLYRAERMEFLRLRGDLDGACTDLNALSGELTRPVRPRSSAEAYAYATARYVAANLLRRGGRYERARVLIDAAISMYDPAVPAHRIETTHGTYSVAVCDSMRGVATVQVADWGEGKAVFASSLVTLANSHASWFVQDYQRAVEFAMRAHEGFTEIGYRLYADRAWDLAGLIADWAHRSGRPMNAATGGPDERVSELLSVHAGGQTDFLAAQRPSRALSLLQFALTFGNDPDAPRQVSLPQYLAVTPDDGYQVRTPPPAESFRHAEQTLRNVMGIGADTRVPLAAD